MGMQTVSPDAHGIAVIVLIIAALFLFTRDKLPLESTSLAVIVSLILGFHLFPYQSDGVQVAPADFLSRQLRESSADCDLLADCYR
jgi:NhaP-type Na+/H+ or K+/H+ antiporter